MCLSKGDLDDSVDCVLLLTSQELHLCSSIELRVQSGLDFLSVGLNAFKLLSPEYYAYIIGHYNPLVRHTTQKQ